MQKRTKDCVCSPVGLPCCHTASAPMAAGSSAVQSGCREVLLIAALQEWKRMVRAEIGPNEDAAVQFWSFWLRLAYGCCQFFLKTSPFCYRLNIFFPRRACLVELRLMPAGQRTVSQTSMFFLLRTESTAEHIPLLQSLLQHRIAFFPGGLFCRVPSVSLMNEVLLLSRCTHFRMLLGHSVTQHAELPVTGLWLLVLPQLSEDSESQIASSQQWGIQEDNARRNNHRGRN